MVQELISLMPEELVHYPLERAVALAALGLVLWVVGARFSRSILTLVAVAAGTVIGMRLPAWRGWAIDGMGLAVAAALVLGAGAYLFHRACIGLLLGVGLMVWAGVATWVATAGDAEWQWRSIEWHGDLVQLMRDTWRTLPPGVSPVFQIACLLGLSAGIVAGAWLIKPSRVLAHSLIGLTLVVVMGCVALERSGSRLPASVPGSPAAQGAVLVALVLAGAAWQWRITPPRRDASSNGDGQ